MDKKDQFSYLIGAILEDGCIYIGENTYQLSVTSEDKDFCIKCNMYVKNIFNKNGTVKDVYKKNKYSYSQLVVCSKRLVFFFNKLTEEREKVPKCIYHSYNTKLLFLQGIMDSDGWISKINPSDGYIRYRIGLSNTFKWLPKVHELFGDIGVRVGQITNRKNFSPKTGERIKDSMSFVINTNDYCDKIDFQVLRKKHILDDYRKWRYEKHHKIKV